MRSLLPSLLAVLLAGSSAVAQNQSLEIVKLADGVYGAIYSEYRMDPIEGNSLIVVSDDGVVVVDSGRSPASARAMMAEIRKLTPRPVRYVVNSHWHDDHIFGNQAYQEAFPGVEFVAHVSTGDQMQTKAVPNLKDYGPAYWEKMAADFDVRLAKGTNAEGVPLTEAQKTRLQVQARTVRDFIPRLAGLRIVGPTIAITESVTLHQDERDVRIIHLGSGNTAGDVAVYLPKEKILATGDLLVHPVPFAYGSSVAEWVGTLKTLRQLDADMIIPGHGPVMRDKSYLDLVIALFESLVSQVRDAVTQGLTLEATKKAVDLESFRVRFAGDDAVRRGMFADSILRVALEQVYTSLKAGAPRLDK